MSRPPLPWLIAYRLLGVRLPDEYRAWVAHDVAAKNYVNWRVARTLLTLLLFVGLFYVAQRALWHPPEPATMQKILLIAVAVSLLGSRKAYMRRARRWQRIDARGNPVPPKGLGLLDNVGATVLAVLVLVVFTAASGLYAYSKRPSTAGCREPAEATLDRIRAGFKDPAYRLDAASEVPFTGGSIVAGGVKVPGQEQHRYAFWLVTGSQIYDYAARAAAQATTTFEFPPTQDRVAVEAVVRASTCVQAELGD